MGTPGSPQDSRDGNLLMLLATRMSIRAPFMWSPFFTWIWNKWHIRLLETFNTNSVYSNEKKKTRIHLLFSQINNSVMILNRVVTRFWQSSFLSLTWGFSLISPSGSCCLASWPCQPPPALHSAFYFALDYSTPFTGLYWGAWVTITTLPTCCEPWSLS